MNAKTYNALDDLLGELAVWAGRKDEPFIQRAALKLQECLQECDEDNSSSNQSTDD